ncbi:MAG: gluconokinase [Bacteroidota bacterium]
MTPYILVIDIGTTSTKAVAFATDGTLVARASQEYELLSPQPNFKEQDPADIVQAVKTAAGQTVQKCGCAPFAISWSSAMHSIIAIDEDGTPLTNSIIWADGRSQSYADELRETALGDQLYKQTGTPIHPMSPLCKLAWLRDHQPNIFQQATRFISIKEYIIWQWTGEYIVDESIASASGLYDIRARKWAARALAYAGIQEEQLSKVVPTTQQLPPLKKEVADYLKVNINIPHIISGSDGCVANLGAGINKKGEAALSIGTSGAIRISATQPITSTQAYLFNYIIDNEQYAIGHATNNGGVTHEWLRETIVLEKNVNDIEVGAEALLFLPYLLGERAPVWSTNAKAAFIGLQKKHTEAHLQRAVLEGIAFNLYQLLQEIEEATGAVEIIYASGGYTQNESGMQIIADVFNKMIHLQAHEEGTAWGAAILAMKTLDINYADDKGQSVRSYSPDLSNHEKYNTLYNIWRKLYEQLADTFADLSRF